MKKLFSFPALIMLLCLSVAVCAACKNTYKSTHKHTAGEWSVTSEPTCALEGCRVKVCTECGEEVEREKLSKLEHTESEWRTLLEPTCTLEGERQTVCTCCGEVLKNEKIEKKAHSVTFLNGKPATTLEDGLTDGRTCADCGKVLLAQETIEKLPKKANVTVIKNLRYEGYTSGRLVFNWEEASEYAGVIDRIIVTVTHGKNTEYYQIDCGENSWEYNIIGNSEKYIFSFSPLTRLGFQGNSISKSCQWLPTVTKFNFPRIEITTKDGELPTFDRASGKPNWAWGGGITNNEYVDSVFSIYSGGNRLLYSSAEYGFDGAQIRIRGNTSAYGSKQPFKLKLSEKVDLLEGLVDRKSGVDYRDKHWVLLASGDTFDFAVGATVSSVVGTNWTPAYSYVTLFVNGDYRGLYVLVENVKESEARVDIEDDGYLLELDAYWWNEDFYFETTISKNTPAKFTLKYPEIVGVTNSTPEIAYIKNYITELENALVAGEDVSQWLDYESFAKWMLVHDYLATWDSGGSNMYMYKVDATDGTKLTMGPNWDFDSIYWSANRWQYDTFARIRGNDFFYMPWLFQREEFCDIYEQLYKDTRGKILPAVKETLDKYDTAMYDRLLEYEHDRWGTEHDDFDTQNERIIWWFEQHLVWMGNNI